MGFIILLIAGLCQGSFGMGYKDYKPFSWSAFWAVYCIMCIISACIAAFVSVPDVGMYFSRYSIVAYVCGAVWGLSAVCFSKGIDMIGMSMVYGVSMGVSTIVGSVMPMMLEQSFPSGIYMLTFLIGLCLTIVGICIITAAGIRRDGGIKSSFLGYVLSLFSGLGSGVMNVGFNASKNVGEVVLSHGYSMFGEAAVKWLPVIIGGCIMGVLWCVCEMLVRRECHTLKEKGSIKRSAWLFGVSIIWYAALVLYGLSVAFLGTKYESIGWILFNALALVISVLWGIKSGEWKNKSKKLLSLGCIVLIISWIFLAI